MELLDDVESLKLVQFDPTIGDDGHQLVIVER